MWMTFILHVNQFLLKDFGYFGWLGILYCAGSNLTAKMQRKRIMTNEKKSDLYMHFLVEKTRVYDIHLYMRFRNSACKDVTFTCAFIKTAHV